jgi:hypothetical protein
MRSVALLVFSCFTVVSYAATTNPVPSKPRLQQRASTSVPAPPVDLSYGIFQGYFNSTSQLDIYKGYWGSSHLLSVPHMDPFTDGLQNTIRRTSDRASEVAKAAAPSRQSKSDDSRNSVSVQVSARQ